MLNLLADYIPDVIEPAVMPVIEAAANHPYIIATVSLAVTGGGLFWRMRGRSNSSLAVAGAYRSNCGLHCIAHTWWSLPEDKIRILFTKHPIFTTLMQEFYQYYNLPYEANINDFIKLNNILSHPFDREALWGPVLRRHLFNHLVNHVDEFGAQAWENVAVDNYIPDDRLKLLTEQMGAQLIVHDAVGQQYNPDIPSQRKTTYLPFQNSNWQIEVFNNGVHYDFRLPTERQNIEHNLARENSTGLLKNADNYHLPEEIQDEEIRRQVGETMRVVKLCEQVSNYYDERYTQRLVLE